MNVEDAYAECEAITRREARNFAYGIRLLDPSRRKALSAVYAMARRVDDIGDEPGDNVTKLHALADLRQLILSATSSTNDAVLTALHDAASRFPIPLQAFGELIEGCEMDCRGQQYETFEDLVQYCRRVAGSIGRLSLGVFGSRSPDLASSLADQLGVALQMTNILRDVLEDQRDMRRVYLPIEDLRAFGLTPQLEGSPDALIEVILLNARRARFYYEQGMQLLALLDWRSRSCTAAMAGIYRKLLIEIEQNPREVLSRRISLSRSQKVLVVARSLVVAKSVDGVSR